MSVIGVGEIERLDERLVTGDRSVGKMFADRGELGADACFKAWLLREQAARPLIEDRVRPTRPEQPGVRKP